MAAPSYSPDPIAAVRVQQAALAAEPPSTKHAAAMIVLLGIHGGDTFPLETSDSLGAERIREADSFEAQADEIESQSRLPNGTVGPVAVNMAKQARDAATKLRLLARTDETAAAVVYAIREEPQAWAFEGGYLRSTSIWIWIGDGPKCLELGHRYLAGDGVFKCTKDGTDAQDAIWGAANAWKQGQVAHVPALAGAQSAGQQGQNSDAGQGPTPP